jgi:hypothetical protein
MVAEITKTVGQWIVANVGWSILIFIAILSGFFKIAKIEIDPLGSLIGWIGKKLNQETNKRIDELKADSNQQIKDLRTDLDDFEKNTNEAMTSIQKTSASNCRAVKHEVEEIKKSNDMQTIRQIRAHVLDFANSCMNHRKHSKQDFENIIDENTLYENLVEKYKIKNKVYEEDYKFIMKIYHYCQDNNSFLSDPDAEREETI